MVPEDLFGVSDPMSVLALLLLYGPAYLSNTGAMIFGKAIPKITGMKVWVIDGGKTGKTETDYSEMANHGMVC